MNFRDSYNCILISDFNIENMAGYLRNSPGVPATNVTVAPYGQVMQFLSGDASEYRQNKYDLAIVWTQPHKVIASFNDMINFKTVSVDEVLREVDDFASYLLGIRDKVKYVFVASWVLPAYNRGLGMLDMKFGIGTANTLMRMNVRLSENICDASNIYLLDAWRWAGIAGKNMFNPRSWYMGRIPFGNEVFREAAVDIRSFLGVLSGGTKKIIILDLDDTLWGGIVGDVGWENICLGGHNHIGEAYVDFQSALKSLTNRGVLLAVVSKNEESVALEAMVNHPEMVLKPEDLAGWKINWNDKAQNIVDLMSDLNLGIESAVFIDDSRIERGRVREALPEVYTPEWPEDKRLYTQTLLSLRCFDTPSISTEDIERSKMYVSERKRKAVKKEIGSQEEWLRSCDIKVAVDEINGSNIKRAVQLANKTNQMNLTTRRMSEGELTEWLEGDHERKMWTFRVSDRFGDSGLCGIVSIESDGREGRILDFVLSCRVMGRSVEETMLYWVISYVRSAGLSKVCAHYRPTAKNKPCLDFWKKSGFEPNKANDRFFWLTDKEYQKPDYIQIGVTLP
jgi:FkbH-like protein